MPSFALLFAVTLAIPPAIGRVAVGEVQFNRDIRPLFSETCFACHGPDKGPRRGDLRLDVPDGLYQDLGGYKVIVPGNRGASELYQRLVASDPYERMPHRKSRKTLSPEQVEVIGLWIDEGARWEEHWAYTAPTRPAPPQVEWEAWIANPIDRFVLDRIESAGVVPSPDATPRLFARRLSFDLLGLPPDAGDVEVMEGALEADRETDAELGRIVDELLASPHYGERMAIGWLDVVRYADTVGYHGDQDRSMSPYRDYVIDAFNDNMPFDQFTTEQLAGDLLPGATLQQLVASGYNRLNQITAEGGSQAEEYLAIYAADRVRTTASVWLGTTLGCAQCHDHKYDPFSTRDFYSFGAFFADIEERGVYEGANTSGNWGPSIRVPSPREEADLARIDEGIANLRSQAATASPELALAQDAWEERVNSGGDGPFEFDWIDDAQTNGGRTEGTWRFAEAGKPSVLSGERMRFQQGAGTIQHFFYQASRVVRPGAADRFYAYVWLDPDDPPAQLMIQLHSGDWSHRAFWGEDRIPFGEIGSNKQDHRAAGPIPPSGEWIRLEVDPASVGIPPDAVVDGMAFTQFGGTAWWDRSGLRTEQRLLSIEGLTESLHAILKDHPDERTDEEALALAAFYRNIAPELDEVRGQVKALEGERARVEGAIVTTLITRRTTPRTMRVLPRGDWLDDSGEVVQAAVPASLPQPANTGERAPNRLDLARWLTAPENPLVARTIVNRLWQHFFGTGLSRVLDDLGSQGEWPTHPALLDWLAVEFIESGWDVKHMVKLIVTSHTYRQTSTTTPLARKSDPYNRLFARQESLRLPAELIRDNALAVSGLLNPTIGGPSVKPYQPAGYWAQLNFPERRYERHTDARGLRRGLYTYWCRTFPHPSLQAFGAPSREECAAERERANTPTQALVLLNDPTFVEAAIALAAHMMGEGDRSPESNIERGFQRVLCRPPTANEREVLVDLFRRHGARFAEDPQAAQALIMSVDRSGPQAGDVPSLAAWTSVARVILNLHETITRD